MAGGACARPQSDRHVALHRTSPGCAQCAASDGNDDHISHQGYGPRLRDRDARAPADRAACCGRDLPTGRDAHHRCDTLFRCDLSGCAAGRSAGTPLQGGASIGHLMTEALIAVERLVKRYGVSAVLDDISVTRWPATFSVVTTSIAHSACVGARSLAEIGIRS